MASALENDRLWSIVAVVVAGGIGALVTFAPLPASLSGPLEGAAITLLGFAAAAAKRAQKSS